MKHLERYAKILIPVEYPDGADKATGNIQESIKIAKTLCLKFLDDPENIFKGKLMRVELVEKKLQVAKKVGGVKKIFLPEDNKEDIRRLFPRIQTSQ